MNSLACKFRKIKLVIFFLVIIESVEDFSVILKSCHHAMENKEHIRTIKKVRGIIDTFYTWCSIWFQKVNISFISTKLLNMRFGQRAMKKHSLVFLELINHKISLTVALFWGFHPVPLLTHHSLVLRHMGPRRDTLITKSRGHWCLEGSRIKFLWLCLYVQRHISISSASVILISLITYIINQCLLGPMYV